MAVPRTTRWPIQPHTRAKHLILKHYLDAWLPIMARYNGRIVFIDGFAGPGRYAGGEEGSPIIALRAVLDHAAFQRRPACEIVFCFIEAKADRAEALRAELKKLGSERPIPDWITVDVREGEFAPLMNEILKTVSLGGSQLAPTFVFVDPFGFAGVPMETIARIVHNPSCECLVNFSYEPISRFLEHPDEAIQRHFDELFGSEEWRKAAEAADTSDRRTKLVEAYGRALSKIAKLKYVRTFEMVNEGNRTEYLLFFGTNSSQGLSKMKQAMWKADPDSGQLFSDRSDPNQLVLLRAGGEAGLGTLLRERFREHGFARIEDVELFVLEETPYSEKSHLKRKTLLPMERERPSRIEVRRPRGGANRIGTYPPGTTIRFP